jgi:hypothetical protein
MRGDQPIRKRLAHIAADCLVFGRPLWKESEDQGFAGRAALERRLQCNGGGQDAANAGRGSG